jgi:hypothetical protein
MTFVQDTLSSYRQSASRRPRNLGLLYRRRGCWMPVTGAAVVGCLLPHCGRHSAGAGIDNGPVCR